MTDTRFGQRLARGLAMACVLGLVIATGLWWTLKDTNRKHVTAYFTQAIGLYAGNSVRILGVEVGEVTSVRPEGDRVRVEMTYDRRFTVPADAKALIVAPALVSDRYVQLAPAYTGGDQLDDGAVIPLSRTSVPLEIDELSESLSRVSEALGPDGANADGALSDLLDTAAENLDGNGRALHEAITRLGDAAGTLSGSSDDLFGTVENLAKLSNTLAASDDDMREFEERLADVSDFLERERHNLAATVTELGTTLQLVDDFINDNRERVKSNVDKLAEITQVLVDQRAALAETLDIAPLALGNLVNTYNAASGTLDTRPNMNELTEPPLLMVCNLLKQTPRALDALGKLCADAAGVLDGVVQLPSLAQTVNALNKGKLPPLPLPVLGQITGSGGER
ncbi:MCE family protein [Saccharomonospora viridis]|jgi:phospholipid/cholesterol/gamma-HCH transport system substrate-binding protein|uniref:Virulence factor Mce family protein n=2 Tax=Saccharomonospora viridis TaxID=1852 RepID=C7MTI2_SACVD|nr:MCE family protein [Saccharomonospora viridis]ACU95452.1 virulence factor Mce family protein [Saccharomonospora viridis DSM 43017]KHF45087.1 ABC transporter substrate-binding protein [Saccharomonospora viridis]SFP13746.1 virulence factor Mce family protein [Saccharomonospora viridis]